MTFEEAIQWGRPVKRKNQDDGFARYLNEAGMLLSISRAIISCSINYFITTRGIEEGWEPCLWEHETVGPWETISVANRGTATILEEEANDAPISNAARALLSAITKVEEEAEFDRIATYFGVGAPLEQKLCSCPKLEFIRYGCKCGGR